MCTVQPYHNTDYLKIMVKLHFNTIKENKELQPKLFKKTIIDYFFFSNLDHHRGSDFLNLDHHIGSVITVKGEKVLGKHT